MGDYGSFKRYTDKASLPILQQVMHLCSCYETAEYCLLLQVVQDTEHSLYINLVTAMAHRLQANILAVGRTQPTCGHTYADSMPPGQRRIRSCKGTVSLSNQLFKLDHLQQCKHVACK